MLWVLPLVIFAAGAVALLYASRAATEAGLALREECRRLEDLRSQLVDLRTETDSARSLLDQLRGRSVSRATRG